VPGLPTSMSSAAAGGNSRVCPIGTAHPLCVARHWRAPVTCPHALLYSFHRNRTELKGKLMSALTFEEHTQTVALSAVDDLMTGVLFGIAIASLFFC
jgi:hypothetical protein